MNKYICIVLILCILLLCAFTFNVRDNHIGLYTDPDTGVEYLVYAAGYKGGICPRYNSDGSLKVNYDLLK